MRREGHVARDERRNAATPEVLEDHPQLERAEAARLLGTVLREPRLPAEALALLGAEIRGHEAERLAQHDAVAHEHRAALDGDGEPLVRVQRERIGALQARVARRSGGIEDAEAAVGTV